MGFDIYLYITHFLCILCQDTHISQHSECQLLFVTAGLVWPQFLYLLIHKKLFLPLSSSESYNWIKCCTRQTFEVDKKWKSTLFIFFYQCNNLNFQLMSLVPLSALLHLPSFYDPINPQWIKSSQIKLFFKQIYHKCHFWWPWDNFWRPWDHFWHVDE